MFVAEVTERDLALLEGLNKILDLNLKPKENRREARVLTAANEKNLKPTAQEHGSEKEINLVGFSLSCGLIALLFLLASHIEYLESMNL